MYNHDNVTGESLFFIKLFGKKLMKGTATHQQRNKCVKALNKIGAVATASKLAKWTMSKQKDNGNGEYRKALLTVWNDLKINYSGFSVDMANFVPPESATSKARRNSYNSTQLRTNGTSSVRYAQDKPLKIPEITYQEDDFGARLFPVEFTAEFYSNGKNRDEDDLAYIPVDESVPYKDYTDEQLDAKIKFRGRDYDHFDESYRGERFEGNPQEAFEAVLEYFNNNHRHGMFYGFSRHVTSETGVNSNQLKWLILNSNVLLFEAGSQVRMHYVPYVYVEHSEGYGNYKVRNDFYDIAQADIAKLNAEKKRRKFKFKGKR